MTLINLGTKVDGVRTGYLLDVDEVPRVGDKILLLDGEGVTLARTEVTEVRHVLVSRADFRGGEQSIEVDSE